MDGNGRDAAARAQADTRLAWIIVGMSALVTLTLAIVAGNWAIRRATVAAHAGWQQGRAEAQGRSRDAGETLSTPIPPDTARPIGDVSRWAGPDDYPPAALRAGEEGRVRVTVAIDAAGKPTGCAVAERSGSWSLDNGTCLAMMRNGRFDRARRGEIGARPGEVRRWTSPPVRWILPD